ncbi:uncharacterized protein A1O9_02062 [Exophiala aquamarina CBS 119918]|uniref:Transcription factor domain-containing protein n=1 Tax=Exophiala aquamarina CBS 119918 TaxID=1182545 RepID=A0A072PKU4_9EURO|nr:uncharacterized protein A1O9_02062 [Exophiala aquamarina CBS 119918]KEF60501.1 hypothetical protein A1O9_02062 [Exophiala aquamarina CBS 119918]
MGMLARLAQSAFLLGRVYRCKTHPTGDAQFDLSEKGQLDRALHALLSLTYEEGATRLMAICPQTALCFSALVILHSDDPVPRSSPLTNSVAFAMNHWHDNYVNDETMSAIQTLKFLRPIANESYTNANLFFRREPWSIEKSSPSLLHWTYLIAVTFLQISKSLRKVQGSSKLDEVFMQHATECMKEASLLVPPSDWIHVLREFAVGGNAERRAERSRAVPTVDAMLHRVRGVLNLHDWSTSKPPIFTSITGNSNVIFVKAGMFRKSGVDMSVPVKEQWFRRAEMWETPYASEGNVLV